MTKFYIFDDKKKDWICVKQKRTDIGLAKINKCMFDGKMYNVETVVYNLDTDVIEVMLRD